jgi:hypothetical protein
MHRRWLFALCSTFITSFLLLAYPALADAPVNFTDVTPGAVDFSAPVYGPTPLGGFTIYTDRTAFVTAHPGLPYEDWDSSCTAITSFPAPLNATTTNACFNAGDVLPGIELRDNPLNDEGGGSLNGLVFVPEGAAGALNSFVASNTFTNSHELHFTPSVSAVGLDLGSLTTPATLRVRFYNGVTQITEYNFDSVGPAGAFLGLSDAGGITMVELLAANGAAGNGAEGTYGVFFGAAPTAVTLSDIGVANGVGPAGNSPQPKSRTGESRAAFRLGWTPLQAAQAARRDVFYRRSDEKSQRL